jgi:hypothetical protein
MIDRNAYTSLNEAAANVAVGKSSMRPAMGMNARNMSNSNSPPQGVQWGDPSIGGAMNATELAAYLSGQGNVGVEDAAKAAAASPSSTASALSMKPGSSVSRGSSPVRTATKPAPQATVADDVEYTAQEILDILSEATGFNGAALSRSLANGTHRKYLSQFTPSAGTAPKAKGGASVADDVEYTAQEILDILAEATGQDFNEMCQSAKSDPKPPVRRKVSLRKKLQTEKRGKDFVPTTGMKTNPKLADSVELAIDSVIAEGVAQYGEEVFLEIISDFDETGEMSQELFDLLD